MKIITITIASVAIFAGLVWLAGVAFDKQARVDCLKLKEQAATYDQFYLTAQQDKECRDAGFIINAPIK